MSKIKGLPVLTVILGLLLSSCEIREFVMPSWDVELNIPLINERYYVSDLIDNENFIAAPNNNIFFQASGEVETDYPQGLSWKQQGDPLSIPLPANNAVNGAFSMSNDSSGMQITYGEISQGTLRYAFTDMQDDIWMAQVMLWNIKDSEGNPLHILYNGTQNPQTINLAGYHIGKQGSNQVLTQLNYSVQVISDLPPGSQAGVLTIEIPGAIEFTAVRGIFSNLSLDIDQSSAEVEIDYPSQIDQAVNVTDAQIAVTVINPIGFSFFFEGQFYAVNENTGEERVIDARDDEENPFEVAASVDGIPSITELGFADSVNYLLNIMPTRVELRNACFVITNPDNSIGEIRADDVITGEFLASVPFRFILYNHPITPDDAVKIGISEDNREIIRKNINSASLSLEVVNRLPVGAQVTLYFGLDSEMDVQDEATWVFQKTGHIAPAHGQAEISLVQLELTPPEKEMFTNPEVFMLMEFAFDATNGPVTITASTADYIQVRGMVTVQAHVEEQ